MPHLRTKIVADAGALFPAITSAQALGTDSAGNVISATLPTVPTFVVDGGSATSPGSYTGTLRIDFGAAA